MRNDTGIQGQATIHLFGPDGDLKFYEVRKNLITTAGDQYYAKMGCAGVDSNVAPTLAARMQLGVGTVDVAKSSTGAALGADYISGSTQAFDDVAAAVVSGDTGWKITYTSTWIAGDVINSAITHAAIVTNTTDAAGSVAETISIVEFTAINKGASDSLVINWVHTFFDNPA